MFDVKHEWQKSVMKLMQIILESVRIMQKKSED